MCKETDFEIDPGGSRQTVQGKKEQHSSGYTLVLKALAGNPNEELNAIGNPWGDKGMGEFFHIWLVEYGTECRNDLDMVEWGLAQMFDVDVKG